MKRRIKGTVVVGPVTDMTVKDACRGRWAMKRRRFAKKLVDNLDIREIWIKNRRRRRKTIVVFWFDGHLRCRKKFWP